MILPKLYKTSKHSEIATCTIHIDDTTMIEELELINGKVLHNSITYSTYEEAKKAAQSLYKRKVQIGYIVNE